ncbi:MAG: MAPEG family protein [Pseudomonadales bacterium]|nr:MAPEG family protein [Pseudomonadales bacterium]
MTIAYWCILVAGFGVPFLFTIYAKASPDFDNAAPRTYLASLEGAKLRAYWSVQNLYETFPLFTAAVIIAHLQEVNQSTLNMIAIAFVVLRILYGVLYVVNQSTLRSLVWIGSMACIISLFVLSA